MRHWLLSVNLLLFSLSGIAQEKPSNFSRVKSQLNPKAEAEGVLIGFYSGGEYSTRFFRIGDHKIHELTRTNCLASPQHDGFHYFQEISTSKIRYTGDEDIQDEEYNFSCYDVSSADIVSAKSIKALYKSMFEIKVQEYKGKLEDLEKFDSPKKERYNQCFLYENQTTQIKWIVPGFMQISSHYDAYHGGAHGDYGAVNIIKAMGAHETSELTEQLFIQNDEDQNWQDIKMKAYIKALTLQLDENDYAVTPYDPGDEPEFDFIIDSLEFNEIEPEYPIDDYEDIYYKFLHKNGRLNLGVVFSASAPYILSHTYEFNGSVDAGAIQNKLIGYNGVDIDFGIEALHQLSPKQNVIVICEEDLENTKVHFFDTKTGEFIHSESIQGRPVMLEWCSEKHISAWEKAISDDFSKIIE